MQTTLAARLRLVALFRHVEFLPDGVRKASSQVVLGAVELVRQVIVQVSSRALGVQLRGSRGSDDVAQAVLAVAARTTIRFQFGLIQHVLHLQVLVTLRHAQVQARVVDLADACTRAEHCYRM